MSEYPNREPEETLQELIDRLDKFLYTYGGATPTHLLRFPMVGCDPLSVPDTIRVIAVTALHGCGYPVGTITRKVLQSYTDEYLMSFFDNLNPNMHRDDHARVVVDELAKKIRYDSIEQFKQGKTYLKGGA